MSALREKLGIKDENLREINDFLLREDNPLTNGLLKIVEKYGDVDEINRKAQAKEMAKLFIPKLKRWCSSGS